MMPKVALFFPSSVTCIFPLFEHSKGSTFIRLSKRIVRIFVFFFCLLFYTLYICGRAPCLAVSVLITHHHTTLHTTRTRGVTSGASWTLPASLFSPREDREFTEERAGGSEFSILRGCLLEHLGRFRLLVFLSSRESRIYGGEGGQFRILDSQGLRLQEHFGRFSLRESGIRG